jgi:hypothetical protein
MDWATLGDFFTNASGHPDATTRFQYSITLPMQFISHEKFRQVQGVPEQPTLVFIPLFRSWHKIKCHICPSHCSFYGIADFGRLGDNNNNKKIQY